MRSVRIGYDPWQKRDITKVYFDKDEMPGMQLFNAKDVSCGNPTSNISIGFAYTWPSDAPPDQIMQLFARLSNYAALTGFWRTTNGARYAFSNILANPNINKLIMLVFGQKDNGHLLADALENFWKNCVDEKGIIVGSRAANPRFEQVSIEALGRLRQQADLIVVRNISQEQHDEIEKLVTSCYQEPGNAVPISDFHGLDMAFFSQAIGTERLYDDGARFEAPFKIDLSSGAKGVSYKSHDMKGAIGPSIYAKDLAEAQESVAAYVFCNGTMMSDQRGILTAECRSITITVEDPLEKIPDNFSKEYISKYTSEFLEGSQSVGDEFAYTYHDRIFHRWGDQVEKIVGILRKDPGTRRAMISLWDPENDAGKESPPCLDYIWCTVRPAEDQKKQLELHVVYRSHHLATVTEEGKLMQGEGAFVPNVYALASLQEIMAKKLGVRRGPVTITDFSGHLYISRIKDA